MVNFPFVEAEIEITRSCNLTCEYCVIPHDKRRREDELSIEQWKQGLDNLEKIGVKMINFMGGEPCVKEGVEELIKYVDSKPNMDYLFSTNGIIAGQILDKLLSFGLHNVVVSVDGIYFDPKELRGCGDNEFKSYHGFRLLKKLKEKGVEKLIGNFVVNKQTMERLLDTYKHFAELGLYLNITPEQWRKYGPPEQAPNRLTEEDRPKINELMAKLIEIKIQLDNYLINSNAYLQNFADLGIKQNYKCVQPRSLGFFEDGNLWYCNGWEGNIGQQKKYNILNITNESMEEFLMDWKSDIEGMKCPGCTFSFRDRTGDFDYMCENNIKNIWNN